MDLSSIELHVFVSLTVILGTGLVALVVDYLKGNNENLREHNIELRVRREEEARRSITEIRMLREQMAANADLVTHIERPREAEPRHEPVPVVVNVAPSPPAAQATPESIEQAVHRAVRSATLEMSAAGPAEPAAAEAPPEVEGRGEVVAAAEARPPKEEPPPDTLLDHVIFASMPARQAGAAAPEVELEQVVIYAKGPPDVRAAEPGRVIFLAPVEEPVERAIEAAAAEAAEPAKAPEALVEPPQARVVAPAPVPVEAAAVDTAAPEVVLPAARPVEAAAAALVPEPAPLLQGELQTPEPDAIGSVRESQYEPLPAAEAVPLLAESDLRVVNAAAEGVVEGGVVEEVTLGEPEPASILPQPMAVEPRDARLKRESPAADPASWIPVLAIPSLPATLENAPALEPRPAALFRTEISGVVRDGKAQPRASRELAGEIASLLPDFAIPGRLAPVARTDGYHLAPAALTPLEFAFIPREVTRPANPEPSPAALTGPAPSMGASGLSTAFAFQPLRIEAPADEMTEPVMASDLQLAPPVAATLAPAAVLSAESSVEIAEPPVGFPSLPRKAAGAECVPAAAGRFELPVPVAAAPPAAVLAKSDSPAEDLVRPAIYPALPSESALIAPKPAAAGRFELQVPQEAVTQAAPIRSDLAVESTGQPVVLPSLQREAGTGPFELAAAGRFELPVPQEAVTPAIAIKSALGGESIGQPAAFPSLPREAMTTPFEPAAAGRFELPVPREAVTPAIAIKSALGGESIGQPAAFPSLPREAMTTPFEPAAAGRFELAVPVEAAPVAAKSIESGLPVESAELPAAFPTLPSEAGTAPLEPAAAGRFELAVPVEAAPVAAKAIESGLPVESAELPAAFPTLPSEAGTAPLEPAAAGRFELAVPVEAAPVAAKAIESGLPVGSAELPAAFPTLPSEAGTAPLEPAAAGRFELPVPVETAPEAARAIDSSFPVGSAELPAAFPALPSEAGTTPLEPAAAGRFELAPPEAAIPTAASVAKSDSAIESAGQPTVFPSLPRAVDVPDLMEPAPAGRFELPVPVPEQAAAAAATMGLSTEISGQTLAKPDLPLPTAETWSKAPASATGIELPAAADRSLIRPLASVDSEPLPLPAMLPLAVRDVTIVEPLPAGFFAPLVGSAGPVASEAEVQPVPMGAPAGPHLVFSSGLVVRRETVSEAKPVLVRPAAERPKGFCDSSAIDRLVHDEVTVSGVVVAIGINDYEKVLQGQSKGGAKDLGEAIDKLVRGMLAPDDFAYRRSPDEYILVFCGERGAAAQKRIHQVAERLWDFQLRSLTTYSVLFSWGAVNVDQESFPEAVALAVEEMNETRDSRKGFDVRGVKGRRHAVNF